MASAVATSTAVDVLMEPFNNFTSWTTTGTCSIVTGRTGNAAQIGGSGPPAGNLARYTIPSANETDTITVGFAWRRTDAVTTARDIINFESDAGVTQHNQLIYTPSSTTLNFTRLSTTIGTNSAITFTQNTWYYIEVQCKLHDTAGTAVVRVNGTDVINVSSVDTRNAGTKTVYDRVVLTTDGLSRTGQWDDLYITMGAGAAFKGDITIP
jgi:hypothetical protein